jgi:hypothetical protein
MRNRSKVVSLLALFCSAALFSVGARAQDASAKIKLEISRLQQSAKAQTVTEKDLSEVVSEAEKTLTSAARARDAGRLYFSLEELRRGEDLLEGVRSATDNASVKENSSTFDSVWGAASLRLTAFDKEAHGRVWDRKPLAVRALSETAQGKAVPLLDGARGFATANGPKAGLFYMGQAQGEAEFSRFSASLELTSTKTPFPLRSFVPELEALQEKTNAAFQPPKSIDLHSRFIALNSTIKLAEELDSSRFYAGALYAYLEAVRNYGMLDAKPLDALQQSRTKQDLAEAKKKVVSSSDEDSLAQLFIERAESQIAHPDGSATTEDEWRSGRVIVDQVLPAYYAARKPASPIQKNAGRTVDITLVRWPYT